MAATQQAQGQPEPQQIFVRADEVDAGTSILTPSKELPLSALTPADPDGANTQILPPLTRPGLKREGTGPAPPPPPSQPPPAPPPNGPDVTDSLSLPQLRQLVSQFPKAEQRAYDFHYQDAEDFETEIDEWFHYTELEQDRDYLLASRDAFEQKFKAFSEHHGLSDDNGWPVATDDQRGQFTTHLLDDLASEEYSIRVEALSCIYYILTGVWSTTSGSEVQRGVTKDNVSDDPPAERFNAMQALWMHKGATLLIKPAMIPQLYLCLIRASTAPYSNAHQQSPDAEQATDGAFDESGYRELSLCLSCFYILIESARTRSGTAEGQEIRASILSLQPNYLAFLVSMISRLRWDETYNIPLMHALQLFWKSILLLFGDIGEHLEKIKSILQPRVDPFSAEASHPVLTASPLDYHLFRQEITSKYPAYNPPLPLVPLELEHKTMLPPLSNTTTRFDYTSMGVAGMSSGASRGSILHQPVHIATPAPSPPPSPVGAGGKTGKKQNYQTNQNFPFLYPPLDSSSNAIGGKGSTEIQDLMVGKNWEGSDVPRSIIEAGELFASRMRMSRAMRQLWKERDLFMKYERGWRGDLAEMVNTKDQGTEKSRLTNEEVELNSLNDPSLRSRMEAVEQFFYHALPDLQSLIIVMMKVMLTNVQDIAVRNDGLQDVTQAGGMNRTKSNANMAQSLPVPPTPPRPADITLEDLDNIRSREISQKAVSGAIFLLLKWFKVSHVLKFEYLNQLLLDSNYVQLTLKYFAHQNLEDLVPFRYDRNDLSVWHYCHVHSDHPPLSPTSPDERSESSDGEDAIPPPISRDRPCRATHSDAPATTSAGQHVQADQERPSVDELGNPLGFIPAAPITTFSFRQFQTSIHLLRILQKLTRGKSHRILFLVQFKSSQILRRVLRVPDPMIRLYVLKLFKSQVPYCGRKWRQSNMRVITAIYLHCRPELRDDWLAGMHDANVEGEVDEAVPLEWALRGLTFWWQKRMYPGVMKQGAKQRMARDRNQKGRLGSQVAADLEDESDAAHNSISSFSNVDSDEEDEGGQNIDADERDFFQRELDAIGWGLAGVQVSNETDGISFGEEASSAIQHINFQHQQQHLPTNGTSVNTNMNQHVSFSPGTGINGTTASGETPATSGGQQLRASATTRSLSVSTWETYYTASPSPLPGSNGGLGDDPPAQETEYLTRTYYTCLPRDVEGVQEAIRGVGDEESNLIYWDAGSAGSGDSYQYEAQSELVAMVEAQPSSGVSEWSEGNAQLDFHGQNSSPPRLHAMRRHRRHQSRHHGRQSTVSRIEGRFGAQAQAETRHPPEDGPEGESQLGKNLDMGVSDEERRVLADFDAAVRHMQSSGRASTRQAQTVRLHYSFGVE
ncbi:hypothetical protein LTR84_011398 [Exophiala bonariae]|uniref:Far11/STRP C-terminal domain-containing protein n=1 Tax=Exophiala bonariae TaxID=1690606 RepID=A0AAV9MUG9_9EURO|nr:hypothetical protein LTR84_011398 [Exophiala bonariae]